MPCFIIAKYVIMQQQIMKSWNPNFLKAGCVQGKLNQPTGSGSSILSTLTAQSFRHPFAYLKMAVRSPSRLNVSRAQANPTFQDWCSHTAALRQGNKPSYLNRVCMMPHHHHHRVPHPPLWYDCISAWIRLPPPKFFFNCSSQDLVFSPPPSLLPSSGFVPAYQCP